MRRILACRGIYWTDELERHHQDTVFERVLDHVRTETKIADGQQRDVRFKDMDHSAAQSAGSVTAVVGETLRTWRHEAGLSIREVAERSGLSVSFISLVERGQTEIAVTRLIRLTDVFGRLLSDVTAGIGAGERADGVASNDGPESRTRAYRLAKGVEMSYLGGPEWATQPFMITLEPGAIHGPVMHSYKEVVVCADGHVTMVIDGKPSGLSAGDTLTLESNVHHAYMNTGSTRCRLIALDFRTDDVRALLATWDQIERSTRAGGVTSGQQSAHQGATSEREEREPETDAVSAVDEPSPEARD
jgi:transcriptional regulator with XRE-family HTH domain